MKNALSIFRFLLEATTRGERCALVTLTEVIGSSSRSPGTHMAVSETGLFAGSFSGGCVEAAVVGEALRIIDAGVAESIRFGAGSPFIDIRLPCGGGVDLLFSPCVAIDGVRQAHRWLAGRSPASLIFEPDGSIIAARDDTRLTGWDGDSFVARHAPDLRIAIAGHGPEVLALTKLSRAYGAEVTVLSPDDVIVQSASSAGAHAAILSTPSSTPTLRLDPFTAVVLLFHDHDWEITLLANLLSSSAFYIGAMGSRRTNEKRVAALRERGVAARHIERLTGPVGLIPASRDPDTLALSVLSEIVARYEWRGEAHEVGRESAAMFMI